jgi:hypothetical protein
MSGIILYPRGFLGYDINLPQTSDETNNFFKYSTLPTPVSHRVTGDDKFTFNENVAALYKDMITGVSKVSEFGFREKIIVATMSAFGTDSFKQWCYLQTQGTYFTQLHRNFIEDTLGYLNTGKRSVGLTSWLSILQAKPEFKNVGQSTKITDYFENNALYSVTREKDSVADSILIWSYYEDGFSDLLSTLNILFGDNK